MPKHVKEFRLGQTVNNIRSQGTLCTLLHVEHSWTASGSSGITTSTSSTTTYYRRCSGSRLQRATWRCLRSWCWTRRSALRQGCQSTSRSSAWGRLSTTSGARALCAHCCASNTAGQHRVHLGCAPAPVRPPRTAGAAVVQGFRGPHGGACEVGAGRGAVP